ncbi:MAG: hypothetical protein IH991_25930 [Planctomycetes bacterium]|nr:hypothetical protein [Planctomycetota bacterium]
MVKTYDPLKCIPSANVVRKRLAEIQEQARRLDILLRTAEEIELREKAERRQGGDDDRE